MLKVSINYTDLIYFYTQVPGLDGFPCKWHIQPLTWKLEQQRFTIRRGWVTSTSSRRRGAISSRPLPERTNFGPRSLQLDRPTNAPASRTMASARTVLRQRLTIFSSE